MIITSPKLVELDNTINYICSVDNKELKFSVDIKFKELVSNLSNAAVIAMLMPAMNKGEDIIVEGPISLKLYHNINFVLQDILIKIVPRLKKIKIIAKNIVDDNPLIKKIVLTGFSAGVDAFTTLKDYFIKPYSDIKITHCLFNNVGSLRGYGDNVYNYRFKRMDEIIGGELNLPFILLDSNLDSFYPKKELGFEQTHTVRNAVPPHLLSGLGTTFLYSSTFDYPKVTVKTLNDISVADPIILPLLSTNNVDLWAVGSEYTRLEKTLKISTEPTAFNYLDLCIGKDEKYINCGTCRKCKRALRTFEANGTIENFSNIFNLEKYYSIRNKYNSQLPKLTQMNDADLYLYLKENKLL